ncbi:MAG: hypothetical protein ABFD81_03850 [Syntrophaceae bacterium]
MRTYITCAKRKGHPKVPLEVCLHTCKRRKKCVVFYKIQNPALFPEFEDHAVSGTR